MMDTLVKSNIKLEKCPFCGCGPQLYKATFGGYWLECMCGCQYGRNRFMSKDRVTREWNNYRYHKNHTPVEKWECVEDDNYSGGGYWECPSCKTRISFKGFDMLNDMPYCPRCGDRVKTELEAEND